MGCAQTRSDQANDKDADSLDLTNECEPPESWWVVRGKRPKKERSKRNDVGHGKGDE